MSAAPVETEIGALTMRVTTLEQLVDLLVRVLDPTAVQMDREDRKALVRAADAARLRLPLHAPPPT